MPGLADLTAEAEAEAAADLAPPPPPQDTLPGEGEGADAGFMGSLNAGIVGLGGMAGGGLIPGAIHAVEQQISPRWASAFAENYGKAKEEAERDHSTAYAVGSGLGFATDMLNPIGKIGGSVTGLAKGGGLATRLLAHGAANALTMGAYNVGQQVTNNELSNEDSLSGDPSNFEKIFSAAGKDALLNTAVGVGLGGLGEAFGAIRKGGILSSFAKKPGPVSGAVADQAAGVAGAGMGVRAEAQEASDFIDKMVKSGSTHEQAAEGWQALGQMAREPGSFVGDKIRGVADWMGAKQIANNPKLAEAMAEGAAKRAISATEGEAFRAAQVNKFVAAGDNALREGKDVINELAFSAKPESIRKTISGAFTDHLDAANAIAQDADGFIQRWAGDEAKGGLNIGDATKMVNRYKREVGLIAERAVGGAVENKEASAQLFESANRLKQNFGTLRGIKAQGGAAPAFVHDLSAEVHGGPGATNYGAHAVYERIQKTLENPNIYGGAGQLQAAINAPFAEGITNEMSALGKLTTTLKSEGWQKVAQIHTGKAASFLDAAGSVEGGTDTQSLHDLIENQISRANNLIEHAHLDPKQLAAAERAKLAFSNWRDVVTETVDKSAANARIQRLVADEGAGASKYAGIVGGAIGGTMGGIAGGGVGAAVGGFAGKLSDAVLRPIHNQMALEHLAEIADHGAKSLNKGVSKLLGWSEASTATAHDAKRAMSEIAGVKEAAARPEVMAARTSSFIGDDTHRAAPKTSAGVAAVAARAVSYLATVTPAGRPSVGLLGGGDGNPRYSEAELAKWHQSVEAVKNPAKIVENAKHGSLSREGVRALKAVYPQMYDEMRNQMSTDLAKMKDNGTLAKMPYEQKLMIGLLLDLPADETLTPQFINTMQESKAQDAPPPEQAPQHQKGGGKRPIKLDSASLDPNPTRT